MGLFVNEAELLKKLLSKQEFEKCKQVARGEIELYTDEGLTSKLTEYYTQNNEMPYTTQKAQKETPDEWLSKRLELVFKDA